MIARTKPQYGPAVVNHKLRYLSASAISAFDPEQTGGCPRRWYFEKILGKKAPPSKAQDTGTEVHAQIQHYLVTGENVLGAIALQGKKFLPQPGKDLIVEQDFGDWKTALAARDLILEGLRSNPEDHTLTARTIPIVGAIDLRHRRHVWIDSDGNEHANDDLRSEEHTSELQSQ